MTEPKARHSDKHYGPWPSVATARSFLRGLLHSAVQPTSRSSPTSYEFIDSQVGYLADWLIDQGLGPMAYRRFGENCPNLRPLLHQDAVNAAAETSLYEDILTAIGDRFASQNMPVVLLKGAALALFAYDIPSLRTMVDVDIWVRSENIACASSLLKQLGFEANVKEARPLTLQLLGGGEVQFSHHERPFGLIELHWAPLDGWWLNRTAAIDVAGIWSRLEALDPEHNLFCLGLEDIVIQVAVHLAINHRFGRTPIRALVDIALTAAARPVDWRVVAERAMEWRVATAVWAVLDLLEQLIGVPGAEVAERYLRPTPLRRKLLGRFVTAGSVLAGMDLRSGRKRYLLLLLLVDRPRDMMRLIFRTLWPEKEWLEARYLEPTSRWEHLWAVLRYGRV